MIHKLLYWPFKEWNLVFLMKWNFVEKVKLGHYTMHYAGQWIFWLAMRPVGALLAIIMFYGDSRKFSFYIEPKFYLSWILPNVFDAGAG